MKKLVLVAAVAVVALSSCKKDYTCACSGTGFTQDFLYKSVKKKDAKSACATQNTTYAPVGVTCTLK